ncbi:MAG: hypothetical protein IJ006_09010, partial [Lachnospiraceae bacterium]|nr:hypothetical protein [Lachnospiraceae bacterium]
MQRWMRTKKITVILLLAGMVLSGGCSRKEMALNGEEPIMFLTQGIELTQPLTSEPVLLPSATPTATSTPNQTPTVSIAPTLSPTAALDETSEPNPTS